MSMIPRNWNANNAFYNNWWDNMPTDIFDQGFGMPAMPAMGAIANACPAMPYWMMPSRTQGRQEEKGISRVINDKDKFALKLDVHHFKPEEIKVKMVEDMVTIEGSHEEKTDEHGIISRSFVRKYKLPKECNVEAIQSNMTNDGVLSIQVPKKAIEGTQKERTIPITMGEAKPIGGCTNCDTKKK